MSDYGMIYQTSKGSVSIQTLDVPLFYMGEMKHHSIKLCDGKLEYNDSLNILPLLTLLDIVPHVFHGHFVLKYCVRNNHLCG